MKNLRYSSIIKASPWRKISLGSWRPTGDSSTYSWDDLDITQLEKYAEEHEFNIHTLVIKALSLTVDKHPEINCTVRFGRIYQREVSSVFFHVLPDEGDDLSGLVFRAAHEKATEDLNKAFLFRVKKAREGKAPLEEGKKIFQIVPRLLSKWC